MESSSAKSHRCGGHTTIEKGGEVGCGVLLCYYDDHIKLNKVRPVKPKSLFYCMFFFFSMTVLLLVVGEVKGGGSKIVMRQL